MARHQLRAFVAVEVHGADIGVVARRQVHARAEGAVAVALEHAQGGGSLVGHDDVHGAVGVQVHDLQGVRPVRGGQHRGCREPAGAIPAVHADARGVVVRDHHVQVGIRIHPGQAHQGGAGRRRDAGAGRDAGGPVAQDHGDRVGRVARDDGVQVAIAVHVAHGDADGIVGHRPCQGRGEGAVAHARPERHGPTAVVDGEDVLPAVAGDVRDQKGVRPVARGIGDRGLERPVALPAIDVHVPGTIIGDHHVLRAIAVEVRPRNVIGLRARRDGPGDQEAAIKQGRRACAESRRPGADIIGPALADEGRPCTDLEATDERRRKRVAVHVLEPRAERHPNVALNERTPGKAVPDVGSRHVARARGRKDLVVVVAEHVVGGDPDLDVADVVDRRCGHVLGEADVERIQQGVREAPLGRERGGHDERGHPVGEGHVQDIAPGKPLAG